MVIEALTMLERMVALTSKDSQVIKDADQLWKLCTDDSASSHVRECVARVFAVMKKPVSIMKSISVFLESERPALQMKGALLFVQQLLRGVSTSKRSRLRITDSEMRKVVKKIIHRTMSSHELVCSCSLLGLLAVSRQHHMQMEIANSLYPLLKMSWTTKSSIHRSMLGAILSSLNTNPNLRTKIYKMELRARSMSGWGSTHTVQRQYDRPLQESRTEMLKKKRRPSSAPPQRRRRKNDRKIARQRPSSASRAQQQRRPSRAKKPSDNQMWNDRTTILEFEKRAQKQKRPSSAKLSAASASKYLLKQKINLGSPRSMNRCRHGLRVQHSSESPFTSMQHRSAALVHQRMRTPSPQAVDFTT